VRRRGRSHGDPRLGGERRGIPGEERRDVAVLAEPEENDVEARRPLARSTPLLLPQQAGVSPGFALQIPGLPAQPMQPRCTRQVIEEEALGESEVAGRILRTDGSLVDPVAGDVLPPWPVGESRSGQRLKGAGRRAASRERQRSAAAFPTGGVESLEDPAGGATGEVFGGG
jgi:hypothetical protein